VEDYLEILSLALDTILPMNAVVKPYRFPHAALPLSPDPLSFDP
jgi:hypothetical protein